MKISQTDIPDLIILEPAVFVDPRGYFMETYQQQHYSEIGIDHEFVQDNVSISRKKTLRGLHYQYPNAQAKLVQVLKGEVLDIAVDIRRDSSNFGKWVAVRLSDKNHRQLYIPKGFAHGFCVLSEEAVFYYKCSDYYHPQSENGVLWSDKDLQIDWPVKTPIVSNKDQILPKLKNISSAELPSIKSS